MEYQATKAILVGLCTDNEMDELEKAWMNWNACWIQQAVFVLPK